MQTAICYKSTSKYYTSLLYTKSITKALQDSVQVYVMYILPEGLKGYIWKFRFPSVFIYKGVVLKFNLINNENRKLIVLWQQSFVLLPRAQQTEWALPLKPKSICMVEAAVCRFYRWIWFGMLVTMWATYALQFFWVFVQLVQIQI